MNLEQNSCILIVDDEAVIREYFFLKLKREGYYVVRAENGNDALSQLKKEQVDLVLTDLEMPEMDGFELLEKLSIHHPAVPAIVISALSGPENITRAIQRGAINFLPKPVNSDLLTIIVKKGLQQRKYRLKEEVEGRQDVSIKRFISKVINQCNKYEASYEIPVGITDSFDSLIDTLSWLWKQSALNGGFNGDLKNFPLFAYELLSNSISYGRLSISSSLRDIDEYSDHLFEEALVTALKEQGNKSIRIDFSVSSDHFKVVVNDYGKGFNWRQLPNDVLEVLEKPHGRGILLMTSFGAELSWNEVGNEVTFILHADNGRHNQ